MLKEKKIVIIGAGTMGKAIIQGLQKSGDINGIKAIERSQKSAEKARQALDIEIFVIDNAEQVVREADILVLCVKPQDVGNCLTTVKEWLNPQTSIISIAAGISTKFIENILDTPNPVIRSMPNTPCLISEGMIVLARGCYANADHISNSQELFCSLGKCIELEEKHMNAVTGLSGSGPAFIYLIIEALADGGVMEGLPRKVAIELVAQTLLGASKMVLETGKHPAELKDEVSTPAGCTIGAILSLEDGRIRSVLARGVQEAAKIAARLGS
jgi:pyrroline-5-carboxylate reductase